MNDQRIAEWLTEDAPFGEDSVDDEIDEGRVADDYGDRVDGDADTGDVSAREARTGPGSHDGDDEIPPTDPNTGPGWERRREPSARPPALARLRHLSGALGFEGQEARVLELVEALGRRIRRRPLAALALGVGAGFVIGGALSFRAGRVLLAAGARHVARQLMKQLL